MRTVNAKRRKKDEEEKKSEDKKERAEGNSGEMSKGGRRLQKGGRIQGRRGEEK